MKKFKIILQPRRHNRKYIYDYVAKIINRKNTPLRIGGAVSLVPDNAKTRAVHEAIERYYGSKIPSKFIISSIRRICEQKKEFLDPRKIVLFNENQYQNEKFDYRKITASIEIEWIKGWSLTKQKICLVPAFAVYSGYNRKLIKDKIKPFTPNTTCGLAIHKTLKKATIHGILELLERDSAMIVWLTKRKVPHIDTETIPNPDVQYLIKEIRNEGLKPLILLSTLDIPIPTVISVIYGPKNKIPNATFGLSADIDLPKAIRKSLEEALLIRNTLEILKRKKRLKKVPREKVERLLHHIFFYSFPGNRKHWKFLTHGEKIHFKEIFSKYQFLLDMPKNLSQFISWMYREKNIEVIRVDLSDNILKNQKLRAVKVIMTNIHQMDADYNRRFLGGNRLKKFLVVSRQLNEMPHPFG